MGKRLIYTYIHVPIYTIALIKVDIGPGGVEHPPVGSCGSSANVKPDIYRVSTLLYIVIVFYTTFILYIE